jgi:DNA-binding GntR family transcriptional regulator
LPVRKAGLNLAILPRAHPPPEAFLSTTAFPKPAADADSPGVSPAVSPAVSPKIARAPAQISRAEQIQRDLADAIVRGAIPPGFRLDERELAERFAVSRTPVREALGGLCALGLAERRPRRGVLAALLSPERLNAMFAVMAELEAAAARFAAAAMTTAERRRLADSHDAAQVLVRVGDPDAYEAANRRFHEVLYDGAHNLYLREITLAVRNRLMPFRRAQFHLPDRLARSWAEHDQVVRAVMRGEAEAAARAMRAHVLTVGEASAEYIPHTPMALP